MSLKEGFKRAVLETSLEVGVMEITRVTRNNIKAFLEMSTMQPKVLFKTDKTDKGELIDHDPNRAPIRLTAQKDVLSATVLGLLEELLDLSQNTSRLQKRTIKNQDDQKLFPYPIGTVLQYRTYPLRRSGIIVKRFSVVKGDVIGSDEWALQKGHTYNATPLLHVPS